MKVFQPPSTNGEEILIDHAIDDPLIQRDNPEKFINDQFQLARGPNKLYVRLERLLLNYLPNEMANDIAEPLQQQAKQMIRTGQASRTEKIPGEIPPYIMGTDDIDKLTSEAWECLRKKQVSTSGSRQGSVHVVDRLEMLLDTYVRMEQIGHGPSRESQEQTTDDEERKDECFGLRQLLKDIKSALRNTKTRKSSPYQLNKKTQGMFKTIIRR